jgi:NTP pyrophosphohydrolases including oxidative damage repair enzymes
MYKIYYNDRKIILTDNLNHSKLTEIEKTFPVYPYSDHKKRFKDAIKAISENEFQNGTIFYSENVGKLFAKFADHYKIVYAAGGIVYNQNKEALFIFRNNKWDLPKGKAEDNESIGQTAHREVVEEVGLRALNTKDFLCNTFHLYKGRKGMMLKNTFWYVMETNQEKFTLQKEEGIQKAKWQNVASFLKYTSPYYGTIADVCYEALEYENYTSVVRF